MPTQNVFFTYLKKIPPRFKLGPEAAAYWPSRLKSHSPQGSRHQGSPLPTPILAAAVAMIVTILVILILGD